MAAEVEKRAGDFLRNTWLEIKSNFEAVEQEEEKPCDSEGFVACFFLQLALLQLGQQLLGLWDLALKSPGQQQQQQ